MKRILCIVVIVLATLLSNVYVPTKVQASSLTEDIGFEVDENLFNVQWYESYYINVYQDCHSTAKNFDKGTLLGKAKITVGVASTKAPIDNKAYQKILIKAEMLPSCVKGYDYGMSQYLKVRVSVYNKMRNVYIEPESSRSETSYTTTGTRGLAFNGGVSRNNEGMLTLNGGTSFSLKASSGTSYTQGALIVDTNKDAGGFAEWTYDYVSSTNKTQNAYLFGSSEQYGVLSWNRDSTSKYVAFEVSIEATFGGGNKVNNKRYQKAGIGKYSLGTYKKTYTGYIKASDPLGRPIVRIPGYSK